MNLTLQQKKALFWCLGMLAAVVLINIAWAQIAAALPRCFSIFH